MFPSHIFCCGCSVFTFSSGYLEGLDYLPRKAKLTLSVLFFPAIIQISKYIHQTAQSAHHREEHLIGAVCPVVLCTDSPQKVWGQMELSLMLCLYFTLGGLV